VTIDEKMIACPPGAEVMTRYRLLVEARCWPDSLLGYKITSIEGATTETS